MTPRISQAERERLMLEHLPYIRQIARGMYFELGRWIPEDELIGVGNLALVEAMIRYRPAAGASPKTWIRTRTRGAMIDYARAQTPGKRGMLERGETPQVLSIDVSATDTARQFAEAIPDPRPTPEQLATTAESTRRTNQRAVGILCALPDRFGFVLHARYIEQQTSRAVSYALNRSIAHVFDLTREALTRARRLAAHRPELAA